MRQRKRMVIKRDDSTAETQRADGEEVSREAQVLELEQPHFLSLVKSPANRTPFSVVRSAEGRIPRKRATGDALLSITISEEISDDAIAETMEGFGITDEDYDVERADGNTYFKRKKRDDDAVPMNIGLANGVVAELDRNVLESHISRSDDHPGLSVIKIRFPESTTRADAEAWLAKRNITYEKEDLFAVAGEQCLIRHDHPEVDLFVVKLGNGIEADVAQTKDDDIPHVIYRQIVEEAYGRGGWGHVDFFQAMIDEQFTSDARNANYWLWDVLDNILFYSDLPLADRLSLVENAVGEFLAWITALMQSLPREVITVNEVDLNSQGGDDTSTSDTEDTEQDTSSTHDEPEETAAMLKDKDKANTDESGATDEEDVTRSQEQGTDTESDAEQEQATDNAQRAEEDGEGTDEQEEEMITLSRKDLNGVVSNAIDTYVESQKRSDENPVVAAVKEAVGGLEERLTKRIDGIEAKQTEVIDRDDADDDGDGDDADGEEEDVTRSEKDPYRGSIFGAQNARKIYGTGAGRD